MENSLPNQAIIPHPSDRKKLWIIVGVGAVITFFLGAAVAAFYVPKKGSEQVAFQVMPLAVLTATPTPAPMPFRDVTIPYLREKTYKSKLGNLEKAYENEDYTAYLTSYTSDGLKINGLLTVPRSRQGETQDEKKKYPAIVFIHGYILPSQYQTNGTSYSSYVDYLARNGFVVFKIDLRGHGESEGEASGGHYGSDYVIDTLNAYAALESSEFVNPKAIGLWGHSMAGNIVVRSMAAKTDIPAVVIWAGAVYSYLDFRKYGISDSSYRPPEMSTERQRKREKLFKAHGQPSKNSPFWKQVAPTNYLQDLKGAVALHHAVNDPVVNIGYSRDFIKLLDKTSVPHELYEYDSGGHNITGVSFTQAMERTVEFFKKYLRDSNT